MPKTILHIISLIFFPGIFIGAQEVPRILPFDKNQYKAYNQNWDITQTPEGLMYFANSAGLLEFDGQYWQTYPLPDKQVLRSVATDGKGRIFGGGYGEFGYWQADTEGNLQYTSLRAQFPHRPAEREEIWNIVLDSQLVLFQSFSEIYAYDYKEVYRVDDPGLMLFINKIEDRWIFPTIQNGLYSWQPEAGLRPIETTPSLNQKRVKAVVPRATGGFWVGTEKDGLYFFDREGRFSAWPTAADEDLKDFQINRIIQLRTGELLIGTILNGVYIVDQQGRLIHHINKESGLQNNTVLGLWEDRNGNAWLALDKGIDLLLLSQDLNFYPDVRGKLGTVYCAQLFKGLLYVGTNQGLYVRNYLTNEDFRLIEGTQSQVWDLGVYDEQLLCGHNHGTFIISGQEIRWISSVTGGWHMQLMPGREDLLLQSTYTGFILYRNTTAGWQFSHRITGLQAPIKQFFFDDENFIWALHSTEGLWRLQLNASLDSVINIQAFDQEEGLPSSFGLDLEQMDGQLLIRSDTSFFKWMPAQKQLAPLKSFRGHPLPGQRVSLIPGRQTEWFLASANRLHWYRGDSLLTDFPVQLVPNFERIIDLDTSTYLFCLDNGYAVLEAGEVKRQTPAIPDPIIRKIEILRPQHRLISPFRLRRLTLATLDLRPQERPIRFYFALPYYGEQVQYRYRLVNYDDQWSAWSSSAVAEFSNLGQGDYIFELEADPGKKIVRQSIQVLPHWYETLFAKLGYVLLSFFAAFLFWRWHRIRLRKQLQKLEQKKEKQLQEERIRARNENLQEDILRKSQELANSTFNLVRKNEILIRLKEALTKNQRSDNRQLIRLIDRHLSDEEDWKIFETNFNQVHEVFFKKLKTEYKELTPGDLRLAAYLRMNLSSKEIAPLLNISLRGVENKRYRLRRKLELDNEENLVDFLMQY